MSAVTDAQLPLVSGSTLGIVANPMSGRDIRRLVARASVFPNAEKTNMVLRLLAAAGAVGVERVLVSTDGMGVAAGVARARDKRRASEGRWPEPEFVELGALVGTADDTRSLVAAMRARGAAVIVLLGGDGTVRAAAATSGDVPLLPLSTGTNNAFPEMWEATVAGTAAALLATARVDTGEVTRRTKTLHVAAGDTREIALVDVCVSTVAHVGSRALWQPETLRELYCAFAEPHAIGLSSIAGLTHPVARTAPHGVAVRLGPASDGAGYSVLAPIAPGVLASIDVVEAGPLLAGDVRRVGLDRGTVAVDGEREIAFGPSDPVTVTLAAEGPRVLDVRAALAAAAGRRLLVTVALQAARR
ncbi:MAG: ATP-NAD/AcoX kinase [Pseudonocardia sp.]|nr:ATP-NAD/AcoX kinase [Pseudonocardia sp.]